MSRYLLVGFALSMLVGFVRAGIGVRFDVRSDDCDIRMYGHFQTATEPDGDPSHQATTADAAKQSITVEFPDGRAEDSDFVSGWIEMFDPIEFEGVTWVQTEDPENWPFHSFTEAVNYNAGSQSVPAYLLHHGGGNVFCRDDSIELDHSIHFPGDATFDGKFDSGDLVRIFQAGKYDRFSRADWTEGDWNGDSLFDSGDLILAFRQGSYASEAVAVPEPRFGLTMFLMCLLFLLHKPNRATG